MKLKVILMSALLSLGGTLTANAQSAGQVRFGVTGGMNVTGITDLGDTESRIGFNLGLRGEYNFSKNVYVNAGLLWSMKGAKYDAEIAGYKGTFKVNPSYLEIPIAVGGRYFISDGLSIFAETGPYFAVGVCGKSKTDVKIGNIKSTEKVDFFGDDGSGAKRFDAGWGLRAGVEVNKFQVHLGYEHGFVNIFDDDCKNWNFNVGVSYMF